MSWTKQLHSFPPRSAWANDWIFQCVHLKRCWSVFSSIVAISMHLEVKQWFRLKAVFLFVKATLDYWNVCFHYLLRLVAAQAFLNALYICFELLCKIEYIRGPYCVSIAVWSVSEYCLTVAGLSVIEFLYLENKSTIYYTDHVTVLILPPQAKWRSTFCLLTLNISQEPSTLMKILRFHPLQRG